MPRNQSPMHLSPRCNAFARRTKKPCRNIPQTEKQASMAANPIAATQADSEISRC
jgi:hypothetical protein